MFSLYFIHFSLKDNDNDFFIGKQSQDVRTDEIFQQKQQG